MASSRRRGSSLLPNRMKCPSPPKARAALGELTSAWNRLIRRFSRSWFSDARSDISRYGTRAMQPSCEHHDKRNSMADRVHIIGASGRSGIALSRSLVADHVSLVPVVRDRAKWHSAGIAVTARHADLTEATQLRDALRDATHIVSCAHARHAAAVLAAAPPS